GGAGALGGDHGGAERVLRRAARAESRAIDRLLHAAQDLAADALPDALWRHRDVGEALQRIEPRIGRRQAETALRNLADAAPGLRSHGEDPAQNLQGRAVAFGSDRAAVLVLDLGAAF